MWKQEPWSPIMAPGKNQLKSKKEDNFPGRRRNNTVQQKKDVSQQTNYFEVNRMSTQVHDNLPLAIALQF